MVLQSTGAISFTQIQTEFGGANPINISEYYTNANPAYTNGVTGLPAVGSVINMSTFRGKAKVVLNNSYTFANNPIVVGPVSNTSVVWNTIKTNYWTGIGTPNWLSEASPYNQSANKQYEKIYNSTSKADVPCRFYFQCDNSGILYLNNTQIGTNSDWQVTSTADGTLRYGNNRIHVSVTNSDPGGTGGFVVSCVRLSDNAVLFITDNTWKMN